MPCAPAASPNSRLLPRTDDLGRGLAIARREAFATISHFFVVWRFSNVISLCDVGEGVLALASFRQQSESPERGLDGIDGLSRKYHVVLVRYFQRRGFKSGDAEDLAQEVFCRLARQSLAEVGSLESYLFVTAGNVARDMVRRNQVRRDHPVSAFVQEIQITEGFSPEREIGSRQELACVLAALNEMPDRMRTIFILARLENLPRAEIANRLGVSKSTVEQAITKATACLADRRRRAT